LKLLRTVALIVAPAGTRSALADRARTLGVEKDRFLEAGVSPAPQGT
jgi:hypothetical protein